MKKYKIVFYIINTIVCLYSLYMFAYTNGNDRFSELLFQSLFVVDAIIIYRNKRNKDR